MFNPSTAPRWKIATKIFLRGLGASAAYSARDNQPGAAPTPNIANPELLRNKRREVIKLSPLEIRRSEYQAGHESRHRLLLRQSSLNRFDSLLGGLPEQNLPPTRGDIVRKLTL